MTEKKFKELVHSFYGVVELPHFERTSFRVKNKIFAALAEESGTATLKFNEEDQAFFYSKYGETFYPAEGKWGIRGWTFVNLKSTGAGILKKALEAAYNNVLKNKTEINS